MKLYSENKNYKLYHGSMFDMLEVIEPNSIDSIVTDPPYGLVSITKRFGKENSKETQFGKDGSFQRLSKGFMGKVWDDSGIETNPDAWAKCYQVLKPGGYLLAFGGTRTFHRIACAIEDAGFEIRDTIMWLYGSGFPKSLNVGLAIDKKNGVDSKVVGTGKSGGAETHSRTMNSITKTGNEAFGGEFEIKQAQNEWDDWGTQLKPAYEPIIVARKPCEGSVVENVLKYGTGAMNLGACRIPLEDDYEIKTTKRQPLSNNNAPFNSKTCGYKPENDIMASANPKGRFPANVIHDGSEEVVKDMPDTKSEGGNSFKDSMFGLTQQKEDLNYHDSGSASRYFYCAKASVKDREEGLEDFEKKRVYEDDHNYGYANTEDDNLGDRIANVKRANTHPTVKPMELMQYLVRLVTPKGGTVLDCFNGSGSTGKAVMFENKENNADLKYIGIELTEEYLPISKARIEYVCNHDFYFSKNDIGRTQHEEIKKPNGVFDIYDFLED